MDRKTIIILSISNSCYYNGNIASSIIQLSDLIKADFPHFFIQSHTLPECEYTIEKSISYYSDAINADFIFTVGGLGHRISHVVSNATCKTVNKQIHDIFTSLCADDLQMSDDRRIIGVRNKTIVINFKWIDILEHYRSVQSILLKLFDLVMNDESDIKKCECIKSVHLLENYECNPRVADGHCIINMKEASNMIEDIFKRQSARTSIKIPAADSLGFISGENINIDKFFPFKGVSLKDGFACNHFYGLEDKTVCDKVIVGKKKTSFYRNKCVFVKKGSILPEGADCVIQISDTKTIKEKENNENQIIKIMATPIKNQNIAHCMEETRVIIPAGKKISYMEMSILNTIKKKNITVYKKPIIGILSTGMDIKLPPLFELNNKYIRYFNMIIFKDMFSAHGFTCTDYGIIDNNFSKLENILEITLAENDITITTIKDKDNKKLFKKVIESVYNAEIIFDYIDVKYGNLLGFYTCLFNGRRRYIFCIPGNLISVIINCQLLIIPSLMYWMGDEHFNIKKINVCLEDDINLEIHSQYLLASMKYVVAQLCPIASLINTQDIIIKSNVGLILELPRIYQGKSVLKKGEKVQANIIKISSCSL